MLKGNKNVIPVVFATDNNFFMPTCVSITSLLANAKEDTFYDIYILVNNNFSEEYKKKTEKFYETFDNFKITYKSVGDAFSRMIVKNPNLKIQAYYRLAIPDVLIQYDKCIYLDGDTIIEKDLQELYNVNIDNYYIAGVKAPTYHLSATKEEYCEKIGLPSIEQYINSGVLLMNLQLIRDKRINEKYQKLSTQNLHFLSDDQDVLNLTCYNYIKHIPFKYNLMTSRLNELKDGLDKVYSHEEVIEARETPVIIHFATGKAKPWENIRVMFSDNWWKHALMSPFKDILSTRKSKIEIEADLFKLINILKTNEEIILFGYSEIGKKIYKILVNNDVDKIVCFCDNDEKKWKEDFEVPILNISEALEEYKNAYILITSQNYHRDINNQLLQLGVSQDRIYRYIRKEYEYYVALDSKYYEKEAKEKDWLDAENYLN